MITKPTPEELDMFFLAAWTKFGTVPSHTEIDHPFFDFREEYWEGDPRIRLVGVTKPKGAALDSPVNLERYKEWCEARGLISGDE